MGRGGSSISDAGAKEISLGPKHPLPMLCTKVLSLSGISKGMVVRTSMMADSGMLTLGLEAWEKKEKE